MSTIVLTGGGTAGHITPNLALVPYLKNKFENIVYLGGSGMEKKLVPAHGLKFYETKTVKLNRGSLLSNFKIPFVLLKGISEAKSIFKAIKPQVVFSKGGYAALPACYAAKSMGIPVVIHESDFSMGVANKMTAKFARAVLTSFPETGYTFTGNPIRADILTGDKAKAKLNYNIDNRPTILIFGGSLGAEAINKVIYTAVEELTKNYNVFHITGKNFTPLKTNGYYQKEYADDIKDLFALAELVIIRGGANSLCEAAALGKRTICIPLPKGTSRGDQLDNAVSYEKRGYINIIKQEDLKEKLLIDKINEVIKTPSPKRMESHANKLIVEEILKACRFAANGQLTIMGNP